MQRETIYTGEFNSKEYGTDSFQKPHLMQERISFNTFFGEINQVHDAHV